MSSRPVEVRVAHEQQIAQSPASTAAFIAAMSLAAAAGTAGVGDPHGVWMIEREVAVEIFDCNGLAMWPDRLPKGTAR